MYSPSQNRARRAHWGAVLRVVLVAGLLVLGLASCSKDSSKSSSTSNAKLAASALDAGLKAHAQGDLTTAEADYNKVLKYDAGNKYAYYNLALIDVAQKNYGLAVEKYDSALKSDPKYTPALFNLAILTSGTDPQAAIALYKRAVAVDDTYAAAWLNLGLLQRANGQKATGDKSVAKAIALDSSLKDPAHPAQGGGPASP